MYYTAIFQCMVVVLYCTSLNMQCCADMCCCYLISFHSSPSWTILLALQIPMQGRFNPMGGMGPALVGAKPGLFMFSANFLNY